MVDEQNMNSQVEWNMASMINMELANLNSQANDSFIRRDYSKAIDCQKSKRMMACYTFNKEEREKLKEMEDRLDILVRGIAGLTSWNSETVKSSLIALFKLKKLYSNYVELLNDTLDKYAWFGGRKKDSTRMKI